jgi:hypothetical protein
MTFMVFAAGIFAGVSGTLGVCAFGSSVTIDLMKTKSFAIELIEMVSIRTCLIPQTREDEEPTGEPELDWFKICVSLRTATDRERQEENVAINLVDHGSRHAFGAASPDHHPIVTIEIRGLGGPAAVGGACPEPARSYCLDTVMAHEPRDPATARRVPQAAQGRMDSRPAIAPAMCQMEAPDLGEQGANRERLALILDDAEFHFGGSEKMRSVFFKISRSMRRRSFSRRRRAFSAAKSTPAGGIAACVLGRRGDPALLLAVLLILTKVARLQIAGARVRCQAFGIASVLSQFLTIARPSNRGGAEHGDFRAALNREPDPRSRNAALNRSDNLG